ncbi:MAG: AMP-binding protein [Deltaproteobacteria bacterium]|nr:AMP-binding protein [Deltaproteobacteria bacterium]
MKRLPRGPRTTDALLSGAPIDVEKTLAGKELLVLGGTGFVGKVTVSLLLARYPGIGKLHLLMRRGGYRNAWQRLEEEFLRSVPFRHWQESMGMDAWIEHARTLFDVIDGDITLPGLGVDDDHWVKLQGRIAAVFNVSGVVDFTPPLDEAIDVNCRGVQHILQVARVLGNVPVVHTSTCYVAGAISGTVREDPPDTKAFPRQDDLPGVVFDPEREVEECVALIEAARAQADHADKQVMFAERARARAERHGEPQDGAGHRKLVADERRKWVREELIRQGTQRAEQWGFTNIYTFTKKVGELLVKQGALPFTIVRPAIVECSMEWPVKGWNEGVNTCAPLTYLGLKGQLGFVGDGVVSLDIIPVDWVGAGLILALAALLHGKQREVYQLGTSDLAPFPMDRVVELTGLYKRTRARVRPLGPPALVPLLRKLEPIAVPEAEWRRTSSPMVKAVAGGLSRALRAASPAVPPLKAVAGALSALEKQASNTQKIFELFMPFTWINRYTFVCGHMRELRDHVLEQDRIRLPYWPEQIDWRHYWHEVQLPGLEKWVYPEIDRRLAREIQPVTRFDDLVQLIDEVSRTWGNKIALQDLTPDGLKQVTYRQLRDRADAAAVELLGMGVKPQDRVVLCSEGQSAWSIGYFAILKAGGTAVPVDHALPAETLARLVRASRASAVLLSRKRHQAIGRLLNDLLGSSDEDPQHVPHILVLEELAEKATDRAAWDTPRALVPRAQRSEIASLIFTSGTTGKPKGVQLTHANFTSLMAGLAPIFPLGHRDAGLSVLPLHHTFEFTGGLLMPLHKGGRVTYLQEINAEQLRAGMKAGGVTAMIGVPALWQLLERRIRSEVQQRGLVTTAVFDGLLALNRWLWRDMNLNLGRLFFRDAHDRMGGRIRALISGGAALPPSTQEFFQGLGFELLQGYGLTEASPVISVHRMGKYALPGSVGVAVPGVEMKIDAPDAAGVGEILARGPTIMRGYEDNAEATQAVITDGWLRTGDLGRIDSKGRLFVVGRAKEVIVSASGENVYPDQVEADLEGVEGVSEISIVGLPDGQGGEVVACLWVPRTPGEGESEAFIRARSERALRDRIRQLPENDRPRVVHSTSIPLPRTATRKVRRSEVVQELQRLEEQRQQGVAESAVLEEGLALRVRVAVAEALARPVADVRINARLAADLGVDSLARTEILVALERLRGGPVDPDRVTQADTVQELVELIRTTPAPVLGDPTPRDPSPVVNPEDVDVELPAPVKRVVRDVLGVGQRALYERAFRTRVHGRERVPLNRNLIVAANHASHLDMGLVKVALGDAGLDLQSLAARDYFFDGPLRRFYFENFTNLVPMERSGSLKQSLRKAGEVLDQGRSLLLFPEGTRSPDGQMQEFKSVLGYLALHHGVDIVPVWLGGTHDSMPKGAIIPRKRDLTVTFGVPLTIEQLRERTRGLGHSDAYREAARLCQRAVELLRDGSLLDLSRADADVGGPVDDGPLLPRLFGSLEKTFDPARVEQPVTYYFSLGDGADAKWTVKVTKDAVSIVNQKTADQADCVLKTSAEMFRRIVEERYTPTVMEFMSGTVKSNDPELLLQFQKFFGLA